MELLPINSAAVVSIDGLSGQCSDRNTPNTHTSHLNLHSEKGYLSWTSKHNQIYEIFNSCNIASNCTVQQLARLLNRHKRWKLKVCLLFTSSHPQKSNLLCYLPFICIVVTLVMSLMLSCISVTSLVPGFSRVVCSGHTYVVVPSSSVFSWKFGKR